jgi:hypothetical protein
MIHSLFANSLKLIFVLYLLINVGNTLPSQVYRCHMYGNHENNCISDCTCKFCYDNDTLSCVDDFYDKCGNTSKETSFCKKEGVVISVLVIVASAIIVIGIAIVFFSIFSFMVVTYYVDLRDLLLPPCFVTFVKHHLYCFIDCLYDRYKSKSEMKIQLRDDMENGRFICDELEQQYDDNGLYQKK